MNPTFRSSSPQPSTYESHHDPESSLRDDIGLPNARTSLQGEEGFNARSSHGSAAPRPLAPSQAAAQPDPYVNAPQIPHNPYPADGMTQFCRPEMGPPSERSSVPSPTRPDSRDSLEHSDYSAPTSFSSIEPSSRHQSPTKQYNGSNLSGLSGMSSDADDTQTQKKKGGFFQSHSPFRRRSNKSKEPIQPATIAPTQRNTWTPATVRETASAGTSPTKPFGAGNRASTWQQKQPSPSPDPDPVGPQTNYQLGVGNNVFDVESPDKRNKSSPTKSRQSELDPIAQALAELKGVTKQASVRQSADRHYGMATPAPGTPAFDGRGMPAGAVPTPFASRSNVATPPPAYDTAPVSRLGAPQPAHTSKDMQRSTERFVNQKRDMYNTGVQSRPGSSVGRGVEPPRAASPQPPRAASPRPFYNTDPRQQQQHREQSPNPYSGQQSVRPRAQSSSPIKPQPNYGGYQSRGGSPGYQVPRAASPNPAYSRQPAPVATPRAASPNPAYARPAPVTDFSFNAGSTRPLSSRGSDHGGNAMVLAPAGQDPYGSQRGSRPQSQYYPEQGYGTQQVASRNRSQSAGTQRQVTKDGKPILHYSRAMYMYQAAIPEELTFAKGDILAVTRHQDDGWWEAEVCGQSGHTGLVPSNYLKNV
ncbi:formin-binding protein [Teratosphaeriaceae sp. CCFEE 6253]|nr:formin-binding protein [Teratosphaeriaceae sp. CCFEE 6253]